MVEAHNGLIKNVKDLYILIRKDQEVYLSEKKQIVYIICDI